jgi:hypothetical protein
MVLTARCMDTENRGKGLFRQIFELVDYDFAIAVFPNFDRLLFQLLS